uniref:Uncharacterized protein n=1 Tax=Coccidioides posadasii RMSCC 3488 TaxID=454284 RepID=A0A0J6F1A7_COCPO|nr:hypothetical protein CPAG_00221 [Coccidioides posadasii RMSCC 3488]
MAYGSWCDVLIKLNDFNENPPKRANEGFDALTRRWQRNRMEFKTFERLLFRGIAAFPREKRVRGGVRDSQCAAPFSCPRKHEGSGTGNLGCSTLLQSHPGSGHGRYLTLILLTSYTNDHGLAVYVSPQKLAFWRSPMKAVGHSRRERANSWIMDPYSSSPSGSMPHGKARGAP